MDNQSSWYVQLENPFNIHHAYLILQNNPHIRTYATQQKRKLIDFMLIALTGFCMGVIAYMLWIINTPGGDV